MTPTQFNRDSARVLRTARSGQDVVVPYSDGTTVIVTRIGKTGDPIADAIRAGRMRPAMPLVNDGAFAPLRVDPEVARQIIADFEAERAADEY